MIESGIRDNSSEWRLFIDLSKYSLKAVVFHNGNIHPSLPIAHSVVMKETYCCMPRGQLCNQRSLR